MSGVAGKVVSISDERLLVYRTFSNESQVSIVEVQRNFFIFTINYSY